VTVTSPSVRPVEPTRRPGPIPARASQALVRLCYWSLRRTLELLALARRSGFDRDVELMVLRQENMVLSRQIGQPAHDDADRAILSALARVLPRPRWSAFLVKPATVVGWHHRLASWRRARRSRHRTGRPPVDPAVESLVCRLARENPSWGYRRIGGELARLGVAVAPSTVWAVLRRNNISSAPRNKESTWAEFLRTQAAGIVSCDFFCVPTITLRHLHVLVFIHHATRQILHIAVTHNPTARFTTNAAKGLLMRLDDIGATIKFVIRDRGCHYAPDLFDHVFTTSDIRVILTPLRSPKANAICERVIGTLRRECTDHFLILGPTHLRRILREYIEHYNQHRPHRTLGEPPCGRPEDHPVRDPRAGPIDITRRQALGGLTNEYHAAA